MVRSTAQELRRAASIRFPSCRRVSTGPSLHSPQNRSSSPTTIQKPLRVVIPANDGGGLACHLDVQAGPTGGVRGRVVDGSGKPLDGSVAAHRVGASAQEFSFDRGESKAGKFEVEYLSDGEYKLEFSDYRTNQHGFTSATVRDGVVTDGAVIVAARSKP